MNYKPDSKDFFKDFQNVDRKKTGLWVRWLWPDTVEESVIDRELKALADAGIAGAEIGLHAMASTWGTDGYFQGLIWALRSAKKYGLKLDFFITVGTICLPQSLLAKDCDGAEKLLNYYETAVTVPSGGDGKVTVTLGVPKKSRTTITARLVGVSYALVKGKGETTTLSETNCGALFEDDLHITSYKPETKPLWQLLGQNEENELLKFGYNPENHKFDMEVLEQNTDIFTVNLNLPANNSACGREYMVFAYWEIPSTKTFGGAEQYCVDHYSLAGTRAVTDFYDKTVERFPELGQLFKAVGRAWFGDSLENNGNWTMGILEKYYQLFGRDITPFLYTIAKQPNGFRPEMPMPEMMPGGQKETVKKGSPVKAEPKPDRGDMPFPPPGFGVEKLRFTCKNVDKYQKSYYEAMTDSFINNHILAYQTWADKYDMDVRYQSTYGQKQFMAQVSRYIDIAETESLAYHDEVDGYRGQAGAVHMARDRSGILSSEQGENAENQFHSTTFSGDYLWRSNRFYVAGGNQLVYHVFAYSKYDKALSHFNSNMVWPGFRPQPNVGDNLQWNRPNMSYMTDYSGYIARTQLLLRTGEARLDAAIYYHGYNNDARDFDAFYHGDELEKSGYSYEFIDPSFFKMENATVEDGVFAKNGPGYRAFLFNNQADLPLEAAKSLLQYAKAGLPMVFAGDMPQKCSYSVSKEADAAVVEISKELLKLKNVRHVVSADKWPQALSELGADPSLKPNGASLMYACRKADDGDYYFLYNQKKYFGDEKWLPLPDIDTEITLKSTVKGAKPYELNLWSGEIAPITDYKLTRGGYITLPLKLKGGATKAIALAADGWFKGGKPKKKVMTGESAAVENWSLKVESHKPGKLALSGDDLTDTEKELIDLGSMVAAKPWTDFAPNVSGVGTYEAKVNWDADADGAVLDLGSVCDLFRLTVNGSVVPGADPITPEMDVGPYLKKGENHIKVEVASNFFLAENSRNYLNCNGIVIKPYTAVRFGILGNPTLKMYKYKG